MPIPQVEWHYNLMAFRISAPGGSGWVLAGWQPLITVPPQPNALFELTLKASSGTHLHSKQGPHQVREIRQSQRWGHCGSTLKQFSGPQAKILLWEF